MYLLRESAYGGIEHIIWKHTHGISNTVPLRLPAPRQGNSYGDFKNVVQLLAVLSFTCSFIKSWLFEVPAHLGLPLASIIKGTVCITEVQMFRILSIILLISWMTVIQDILSFLRHPLHSWLCVFETPSTFLIVCFWDILYILHRVFETPSTFFIVFLRHPIHSWSCVFETPPTFFIVCFWDTLHSWSCVFETPHTFLIVCFCDTPTFLICVF